jgi:hypothetical protein
MVDPVANQGLQYQCLKEADGKEGHEMKSWTLRLLCTKLAEDSYGYEYWIEVAAGCHLELRYD